MKLSLYEPKKKNRKQIELFLIFRAAQFKYGFCLKDKKITRFNCFWRPLEWCNKESKLDVLYGRKTTQTSLLLPNWNAFFRRNEIATPALSSLHNLALNFRKLPVFTWILHKKMPRITWATYSTGVPATLQALAMVYGVEQHLAWVLKTSILMAN
jgi:hypothetical protein